METVKCTDYKYSICCEALIEVTKEGTLCSTCRKPNPMSLCAECTLQDTCLNEEEIKPERLFEEKWGDLIKEAGNYNFIAHGCNCFCTMGGGIAFGIAKTFPKAAEVDKHTIYGDINKLGNIHVINIDNNITIINCYTQYKPGADISYAAIELCLRKLNQECIGKTLAIPFIGAGIAGGNPTIIKKMMKDILVDVNVTLIHWDGEKEKFNNEFPK